ncbi:hypothetical protein BX600DRAFT_546898 [Xylariales sp. PMI_506]|nr:hypothetical protein BX600DRAFT_546898 [Xylariales sp. PMI_506]
MSSPSSPSAVGGSVPSVTTRETIQPLLPTCQRCRRLRRKCDTQLPNCRLCEKSGDECTFYDHALKQSLPRAYVESLLVRLDQLQAVKNGIAVSPRQPKTPQNAEPSAIRQPTETPKERVDDNGPNQVASPATFDVIIPSKSSAGKSQYWGSSSVFALAVEIIHHAYKKDLIPSGDLLIPYAEKNAVDATADKRSFHREIYHAPPGDVRDLVALYLVSINTLYGFVDEQVASSDTDAYLMLREVPGFPALDLHGTEAHKYFRVNMMCAIACANQARYRPSRTAESLAYYSSAVTYVEEVTSEVSPASLQALLLLIVFCLFYPTKGDIWKLLDYACRLTVELGYHTEQVLDQDAAAATAGVSPGLDPSMEDATQERQPKKLRRATFWGLYAIERIVGQLFGRGSDIPETIITTEYPVPSPTDPSSSTASTSATSTDHSNLQFLSIAHHYRLVFLRSELFRAMYVPAAPPDLSLDWLRDKYRALHAWRSELAVSDELSGVATITCDVGYDATMCFLFQPLMLRALRSTHGPPPPPPPPVPFQTGLAVTANASPSSPVVLLPTPSAAATGGIDGGDRLPDESNPPVVVADSYWSACNLIHTYEKVIRAPENSALGAYPMTFLSAHYIWVAASTLLGHALLAVDGRTRVLPRFCDKASSSSCTGVGAGAASHSPHSSSGVGSNDDSVTAHSATEVIDFGTFVDIQGSCLILLGWCCERWPGMVSMLEEYKKLFKRLTRELIRKGLIR